MIGTTNTGINDTIFFEYGDIYSEKVKDFDAEVSGIVKSGNAANFRERVIREDVVIKSSWQFKSLLHHAVTCEGENKIEMISAVLQSSMENINHQDEDDNTPLMYLLYEAQEKGKYTKEDLEKIIRFLVERGASVEMRNNEGTTADDLITVLISKKILDDGIDKIIDEAKKSSSLPNQIKEQLSKHITNNGNSIIQEVAVYGNYAQIKLNSDGTELKISEFLQGDFCKDNGISGFSTFHNDDKGGMHGFLSPNGVRNYTVTDGSYDMTLDWVVGGKKCTITINISKDGVVVIDENGVIVEDKNGLTDEQLKANEYVTINGVSLFDAINKGRNREQNIKQENIHETNKVVPKSKEQLRRREAPLQRNVQQQKFATNKRDDLQYQNVPDSKGKTNPEVAGWFRGDTGLGVVSAPTNVDDSMTIRLLSESKFQAKVNPKKASTPKRTEQSDPQDTSSESIDGGKNTPEFIEYEQYYNNLMANSRNRDDLQNTSPKSLDWPDGNTESDSGLGSSYSNLTTFDPKELEASLLLLKQKQGEQLFDRMLAQMKNKDVDIYKWMEEKREEAASGNGLEDQSGCKLDQKKLPTSQQSTEKDSSILNSSEDERGLKPVDRNKMTKQTLEYLYGADVHDEPKHAEEVRTEPTCNHDKTRVRQANKQEGPHASRVRANSSQGKGVHSR